MMPAVRKLFPAVPPVAPPGEGFGDADYALFQTKVQTLTGIRLSDYKSDQMRRRIATMAQRSNQTSYLAFFSAMERDPALLEQFRTNITINVSELFRNPNRFDELANKVIPAILRDRAAPGPFSVWSAGCSYGAEAYSLATLLQERSPAQPYKILGTDIDAPILEKACAGQFSDADMANVTAERRGKFFLPVAGGGWKASPALRANVRFTRHDLLADAYPKAEYDLIACRNVVIYFTDPAKDRIYRGFHQALKPGGILFVGGTERLPDPASLGFELLMPFFYRKPR